ncbi:MAG: DUF4469 domain-containing protein, partial [Treponema sp.]|nr:DUF4469 domain-containing protein [Treponema sp.]
MSIIDNLNEVLHKIKVRLYPNYLTSVTGAYIARTVNEATLTIEEICVALKNRGGFTGNYDDLVEHVHQFLNEAAYQLCDGFAINLKYFSLHLSVGGTFDKTTETYDPKKHPIAFRFRARTPLRTLANLIAVEIDGLANVSGYIDEIIDVSTEAVNETLTPGGMFNIAGHRIKIAGDKPEIGISFVSVSEPDKRVKVNSHLAENTSNKLIGIIPALDPGVWKVEIVTQFTTGGTFLKEPRVLESGIELT